MRWVIATATVAGGDLPLSVSCVFCSVVVGSLGALFVAAAPSFLSMPLPLSLMHVNYCFPSVLYIFTLFWRNPPGPFSLFFFFFSRTAVVGVKQVSGLLLSTPVETVPILVAYSAVSGGIFFHAPPLGATPPAAASPPPREQNNDQPETGTGPSAAMASGKVLDSPVDQEAVDSSPAAAKTQREEEVAVAYLENAFPGKLRAAPVSLRSTAASEGRVEGMKSSGPLVRAVLTRTDVPAGPLAAAASVSAERGAAAGGGPSPGTTSDSSAVQVRENKNASRKWKPWAWPAGHRWAGCSRLALQSDVCKFVASGTPQAAGSFQFSFLFFVDYLLPFYRY